MIEAAAAAAATRSLKWYASHKDQVLASSRSADHVEASPKLLDVVSSSEGELAKVGLLYTHEDASPSTKR